MSYISIHSSAAINIFHNLVHQHYFHHPDKVTGSFQLSCIQFFSFFFFFTRTTLHRSACIQNKRCAFQRIVFFKHRCRRVYHLKRKYSCRIFTTSINRQKRRQLDVYCDNRHVASRCETWIAFNRYSYRQGKGSMDVEWFYRQSSTVTKADSQFREREKYPPIVEHLLFNLLSDPLSASLSNSGDSRHRRFWILNLSLLCRVT